MAVPVLVVGVAFAAGVGSSGDVRRTTGSVGTTVGGTTASPVASSEPDGSGSAAVSTSDGSPSPEVGATSTSEGQPSPEVGTTWGPRRLGVPVELRPVLSEDASGPCASPGADQLSAPGGSGCLSLGPARMTIRALASLGVGPAVTSQGVLDPSQETLDLTLTDADARDFATLTAGMLGQRLAVVVDGAVLTAPTIAGVIESGQLQIPGPTAVLRPVVVALTR